MPNMAIKYTRSPDHTVSLNSVFIQISCDIFKSDKLYELTFLKLIYERHADSKDEETVSGHKKIKYEANKHGIARSSQDHGAKH